MFTLNIRLIHLEQEKLYEINLKKKTKQNVAF